MSTNNDPPAENINTILKIFNFVGSTLIIFGVVYFIGSNWDSLNDFLRIFTTLGSAIAAYVVAILLAVNPKYRAASSAFFLISAITLPLGCRITLNIADLDNNDEMVATFIAGLCLFTFLTANLYLRQNILRLFCAYYASLFFIAFTSLLFDQALAFHNPHLYDFQFFVLGFCYVLAGYYFQKSVLAGLAFYVGSLFILFSSFDLGGLFFHEEPYGIIWKIIAPLLVLLSFILAGRLRSSSFLYNGAIFLLIYLANITSLYAPLFGKLGWPLLLILAGLFFMVFGYTLVSIHRRFIR